MADPVLHIKDAYFFEVPKILAPAAYRKRADFPEVWVKLDPEFQDWEFGQLYTQLVAAGVELPAQDVVHTDWKHWQHEDHAHFAAPFDEFLEHHYQRQMAEYEAWKKAGVAAAQAASDESAARVADERPIEDYLKTHSGTDFYSSFVTLRNTPAFQAKWREIRQKTGSYEAVREYQKDESLPEWSKEKVEAYNYHLSGKVLIPQILGGELRNLHEAESTLVNPTDKWASAGFINRDNFGFAISKFMVIELAVGLVLLLLFSWLAGRVANGAAPRGWLSNLLETFVAFIRDEIARPALDGHHGGEHEHHDHTSAEHAHGEHTHAGQGHPEHGHIGHGHQHEEHLGDTVGHAAVVRHAQEPLPSERYTPILCTIFFFILGMNLAGMLPWVGSPTGTWAVTLAMALITLLVGFIGGLKVFGLGGYFLNQIPGMDLPIYMAVVLKPFIFVIEIMGLIIKHGVLSVRLLANMMAGHMVLLAIMGLAFGATAAYQFSLPSGEVSAWWWLAAVLSVVGCAVLSLLELFVAFLQAYVFTLLSALFIGAAIHKH
jgi:F-type H+-transporting ATPase subunit a